MSLKTLVGAIMGTALLGGGVATADQMQNPYEDKGTHYELPITADIAQGDRVEISKTSPEVTLSRWNDEQRIIITPQFKGSGRVSNAARPLFSKRIEFTKGAVTAFVTPAEKSSDFDIDFTLATRPDSNVFTYSLSGTEDLDFFYQPPLDQIFPDGRDCTPTYCKDTVTGIVREQPEDVVGSYAVYSKSKRDYIEGQTDYGTGKVMHIYRPKAIDSQGNEVWAELYYDAGSLSVTVPQKFLDTATYPVTVDPTFGYTTLGAGSTASNTTTAYGQLVSPYAASSGDTVTSISLGLSDSSSATVDVALYTYTTTLVNRVNTPITVTVNNATSQIWTTSPFSQSLSAGTVYTTAAGSFSNSALAIRTDTGAGNNYSLQFAAALGTTWSEFLKSTSRYTIYATYTAGIPDVTNPADTLLFE